MEGVIGIGLVLVFFGVLLLIVMLNGECKHPFNRLHVERDSTSEPSDIDPKHFDHVSYHLRCGKCMEKLDITYAYMKCSTHEFLHGKREE